MPPPPAPAALAAGGGGRRRRRLRRRGLGVANPTVSMLAAEARGGALAGRWWKAPDFRVSCAAPRQGDSLAIVVRVQPPPNPLAALVRAIGVAAAGGALVHVAWDGARVPCFPCPNREGMWRAIVPTTPLDPPRNYTLDVRVNDCFHRGAVAELALHPHDFLVEHIWLPEGRSGATSDAAAEKRVDDAVSRATPEQLWRGRFLPPVSEDLSVTTTPYGAQRFYNGVFRHGYFHGGVDLAADPGTPVVAPQDGRVVLNGREEEGFAVEGNCLSLDHGHGVTSLYLHLEDVLVSEGAMVCAGDVVATVGNTGASTGPHLHYGILVHGKSVDPTPWMAQCDGDGNGDGRYMRPPWAC